MSSIRAKRQMLRKHWPPPAPGKFMWSAGPKHPGLRKAGLTFIYDGCDALAILQAAHDMLDLR